MQSFTWASCVFSLHFFFSSSHHLHQKPGFAYTPSLSLCFLSARFLCSDPHNRFIDTFPSPRVIRAVYTARCGFHCFYADSPTVVLTCEVQERDPLLPIFFLCCWDVNGKKKKKEIRQTARLQPCNSWVHLNISDEKAALCRGQTEDVHTAHSCMRVCTTRQCQNIDTFLFFPSSTPPPFFFFCSSGSRRVGNEEITALVNSPSERCDMLKCNDLACWTETEHCFKPQRCRGWQPREKRGTEAKVSYPN